MTSTIKFVKRTNKFRREYKKLKKKHYSTNKTGRAIYAIITQNKDKLTRLDNHYLHGDLQGFQELHISSNVLLLYNIDGSMLTLFKIGSHDELFKSTRD